MYRSDASLRLRMSAERTDDGPEAQSSSGEALGAESDDVVGEQGVQKTSVTEDKVLRIVSLDDANLGRPYLLKNLQEELLVVPVGRHVPACVSLKTSVPGSS